MSPRLSPGYFVTATGTGCGKTFVSRAITRAWTDQGLRVAAIKPLETGCTPHDPPDALALQRAADRHDLATDPRLYRTTPPLAPYAAALSSHEQPPHLDHLSAAVAQLVQGADRTLVEGAGGLLVPLDAHHTLADFAARLGLPLLVTAPDQLGALSHVLTLVCAARQARLAIAAIVLVQQAILQGDPSPETNGTILRERLTCPVLHFPLCPDDDAALARAAVSSGLAGLPL